MCEGGEGGIREGRIQDWGDSFYERENLGRLGRE
jgi:hypothetical protein